MIDVGSGGGRRSLVLGRGENGEGVDLLERIEEDERNERDENGNDNYFRTIHALIDSACAFVCLFVCLLDRLLACLIDSFCLF